MRNLADFKKKKIQAKFSFVTQKTHLIRYILAVLKLTAAWSHLLHIPLCSNGCMWNAGVKYHGGGSIKINPTW